MNTIIDKINNDNILPSIMNHSADYEIYLVGGAIRDFILCKENFDKDIVVKCKNPEQYSRELAQKLDATFIPLDEENKIYRLVMKDKVTFVDIAAMVGESIEEDLKRRDFSINSIAINLKTLEIIDINNGLVDLENKLIKHMQEENFSNDPLRTLRAFRFQAQLGFKIDLETKEIIKKYASMINLCSVERINHELIKLFAGAHSHISLYCLDECGLLSEIFPISDDLKKVPPNLHHHLDLFEHSIETVRQVQELYEKSEKNVSLHLDSVEFGANSRLAHLKLAAFLHDIGKPETWTIDGETGKHRFIKHDDVGSKISIEMLKKNKFSKKQISYVSKMIKYHIYPSNVVAAPDLNDKVSMRFVRKMEEDAIDVLILAMADRLSARGVEITDDVIQKNLNGLQKLLDFYLNAKDSLKPLEKLLSGEEIMDILNLKPSRELGNVIKDLHEAQLSGDVIDKNGAIQFIKIKNNS